MKDYSLLNDKIELIHALATSIGNHMTELFENGYDQGYADAKSELGQNAIDLAHEESDRAYQQGLEDAWEAAKKIILDGGLSLQELMQIFNTAYSERILKENTASEAIAKIKEYEDKQKQDTEIKVGDEVYSDAIRNKAIVTYLTDDGNYIAITSNGSLMIKEGLHRLHKTGRHFDQIAEVLNEMRGDKE